MNNLNDLIRIWCLLLILVACNQDDNMDGIPDDATVPCVINSVSVIEPHKVNTRATIGEGDSMKTQCHWPKEFMQTFGQSILIMPIRKTDWIIRIGQPSL